MTGLAWMEQAACAGYPTAWWFPDDRHARRTGTTQRARAICSRCPVSLDCAAYAMRIEAGHIDPRHRQGIWGGLTPTQRTRLATTGALK